MCSLKCCCCGDTPYEQFDNPNYIEQSSGPVTRQPGSRGQQSNERVSFNSTRRTNYGTTGGRHVENLNDKVRVLEQETKYLKHQLEKRENEYKDLQLRVCQKEDEITVLKTDNDECRTRLSAVISTNVTNGNPNIADLSDTNRPTKLAEQYSELYDNAWTDMFDALTEAGKRDDTDAVATILGVFTDIYSMCKSKAADDLQALQNNLHSFMGEDSQVKTELLKKLKDERKKKYKGKVEKIKPDLLTQLEDKHDAPVLDVANTFIHNSIELCWLMAVQDPPLCLDENVDLHGRPFDTALYKHYTKSGKLVDFVVWPVLRLCDGGSLLSKGIAQGMSPTTQSVLLDPDKVADTREEWGEFTQQQEGDVALRKTVDATTERNDTSSDTNE